MLAQIKLVQCNQKFKKKKKKNRAETSTRHLPGWPITGIFKWSVNPYSSPIWRAEYLIILIANSINPIPPGGGGGKCPCRFQLSRTSLIFKQYLRKVAIFTKIYWETRFWKNFVSRVSHVAMATTFSTPHLVKFWLFKSFSPLINEIFKTRANY